jgi:hypothetical protein
MKSVVAKTLGKMLHSVALEGRGERSEKEVGNDKEFICG